MKKTLLSIALIASASLLAQNPVVLNDTFTTQAKINGSECACAGWQNGDLGDQGGNSSDANGDGNDAVKFAKANDDIIYQEVAVTPNTDYKLTYTYQIKGDKTTTTVVKIRILKGSNYIDGYTPTYATVVTERPTSGFGYTDITEVEKAENNLADHTVAATENSDYTTASFVFNSGDETSIAIFARGIGGDDPGEGQSPKGHSFISGDEDARIDDFKLTTEDATASVNDIFSSKISIYPNPANDFVTVSTNETITGMEVYNLIGKKVISSSNTNNKTLNVSNLAKGVYVLKVISNELVASRKIIIE